MDKKYHIVFISGDDIISDFYYYANNIKIAKKYAQMHKLLNGYKCRVSVSLV